MKGLGNLKMKGKLSYSASCFCCNFYNFKKNNKEIFHINKLPNYTSTGYDGTNEYPQLQELFKNESLVIWCDHPVGEDVIFINDSYKGYVRDWLEYLSISNVYNYKFKDYNDLYEFSINKILDLLECK